MRKLLFFLLVLSALPLSRANAENETVSTSAPRLELGHGISIVLPEGWNVFSMQDMERTEKIGNEILKSAGIDEDDRVAKMLLHARSQDNLSGIGISVLPSPGIDWVFNEILPNISPAELEKVARQFYAPQMEAGIITEIYTPYVSTFLGKTCVVFSYSATIAGAPAPRKLKEIHVPDADRRIDITTAYDSRYENQSLPVIEAALDSIRIDFAQKTVRPGAPERGMDYTVYMVLPVLTAIAISFLLTFFLCRFTYRNFLPATVVLIIFSVSAIFRIIALFQKSGWAVLANATNVMDMYNTAKLLGSACAILGSAAGYFYGRKRYSNRLPGPPPGPVQ